MTLKGTVYYMATEDIFSNGWISKVIKYLVAPIPIKKQTTDISAVMTCIRLAREGGTIALAPEGNRTYHGRTLYMKPGIASLVKKLGLPLVHLDQLWWREGWQNVSREEFDVLLDEVLEKAFLPEERG